MEDVPVPPSTPYPPATPKAPGDGIVPPTPKSANSSRMGIGLAGERALSASRLSTTTGRTTSLGTSLSRRTGGSASSSRLQELQQRKNILKSLERADEGMLADVEAKWGKEAARSTMIDYYAAQEDAKRRAIAKELALPKHLQAKGSPIDWGLPVQYDTQTTRTLALPVKMAVDPKWSTDLKKDNDKIGARIEYERLISGCVGTLSPELQFMRPKTHLSNPPTPYFKPGQLERQRA